ncbi:MAG: hypothetical protein HYR60_28680 [Acidobacteria bacterium]|nr:hypothetical protein [Acidobacteriota bacterium]
MADFEFYADTDSKAFEVFVRVQREMAPGDKVAAALEMSEMLMRLAEDDVRRMYPEAGEREVFLRMAARHLDRETMVRAYGWDPE